MCEYEYLLKQNAEFCLNAEDLAISPSSLNSLAAGEKKDLYPFLREGIKQHQTDPWGNARNGTVETLPHFLTGASIRKT